MARRSGRLTVTLSLALVATLGAYARPPVVVAATSPFVDIAGSTFEADIDWLWAEGITTGCDATHFCPGDPVTRAEMASLLVRMFKLTDGVDVDAFRDDDGLSAEPDINRLAHARITTGCASGYFCPYGTVTRAQMASFLARAIPLTVGAGRNYFRDDNGSTHEPNIDRLAAAGIAIGCGRFLYCPKVPITRAEMAGFLHRVVAPEAAPGYPAPGPTTLYLTVDGSDANNPCLAKTAPCRTMLHTLKVAISGDAIEVGPGTFRENNLVIAKDLTISGDPDGRTVFDATGLLCSYPIFRTRATAATLEHLTLTGVEVVEDCVYRHGGGISVGGKLTIVDSTISLNAANWRGGGIYNYGTLTIIDSTISRNVTTRGGGGIYNSGELLIINSTLEGNSADGDGGAFYTEELGGEATTTIINSTVTGNSAGAAGGGLAVTAPATVTLKNSLIVGNTAPTGRDVDGSIASRLASIVGIPAGLTLADILDPTGLADNGGPTQTIALTDSATNPAIDTGDPATCAAAPVSGLDQRGLSRTPPCDIGAYELQP